jgi:hypothetical protein
MKKLFCLTFILLTFSTLYGQTRDQSSAGERTDTQKNYTLMGQRHGVSFFPEVRYPEVEYEAGDSLSFDKYHSADVINTWFRRWAEKYPDIVELYETGKSYEGRPILQAALTNTKTGPASDKPGAYFEGGRHSGEVTASETVLWMAKYLIENYGKDPEVTKLLSTKVIYLRPLNNPDGHNLYMHTAQSNRSTTRPDDNDGDGLLDEDAPDDIDGDGLILTMRWKDEEKGSYIPDPRDSSGRIMKRVAEGQGIYSIAQEGIDNDNDGRINEDGIGGLDLHRNYPENWRPEEEVTGRGYTQYGAGQYPLSETETRAVVLFLLSHPNIYIVNSMDTSMPMHLRPPSTSSSEERMYPEDLAWYQKFDAMGKNITGYQMAGDVYDDYGGGSPLFGHGPDFGYWYYGAIWYGDEIWDGARSKDYDGDGNIDQIDMLKWDDTENDSLGFSSWRPAKHPVYGDVETGGFNPKFFSQNPPAKHLEKWVKNESLFNIEMVKYLPELVWENIEIKRQKVYRSDSADYRINVSYRNNGKLPTALKQAALVKIVTSDKVVIEFDKQDISDTLMTYRVIGESRPERRRNSGRGLSQSGRGRQITSVTRLMPFTRGGEKNTASFTVRVYQNRIISGKASVFSTRGGVLRDKDFIIK